jgi:Na+/H+ antiporter NhaD/arsenite permease-like protein
MMLPKKGQVWTYKDRARLFALIGALPAILVLVAGIFIGNWLAIGLAVIGLAGAAMIWLSAERKYRDEP